MKHRHLTQLHLKPIFNITLLTIILSLSSCGIFDKDLEQDKHLAQFREKILTITDSLDNPKDRIVAFNQVIQEIERDKQIFNIRKRNKLLIEYYFSISQELYDLEKYNDAIQHCNMAISLDSTNASGFYNRACIYKAIDNDSLAILDLTKSISLNNDYADAYYNRAIIYEQAGNSDLALNDYNKVIELKPNYIADVYSNRGTLYALKDEFEKAIHDYKKGLSLDPTNANIYKNRADMYARMGDFENSLNDYEKVLALDSTLVEIYMKRAKIYEEQKDYDTAILDYQRALELDAKNKKIDIKQEAKEAIKRLKPLTKDKK